MSKRISCRVIRSVPFTKSGDLSLHLDRPGNKHYKTCDDVVVNVWGGHTSNSVTYAGWLHIARTLIDDGLVGQVLDCYV